jgi:hypothetical protein
MRDRKPEAGEADEEEHAHHNVGIAVVRTRAFRGKRNYLQKNLWKRKYL